MRRSFRIGPIRLNFTEKGFTSWSIKLGRFSWNSRTRKKKFDTPGPGYMEM
jgi:hypothetical protein